MPQKPMLADRITDITKLRFPLLASRKLDGLRATVQDGKLLSRSLKPLPNVNVQEWFKGLPEGLDGELIVGDPTAKDAEGRSIAFRLTESLVMSDNKTEGLEQLRFWVFDKLGSIGNMPFKVRLNIATIESTGHSRLRTVEHVTVNSVAELEELEEKWLEEGNEGVMVRDPNGPYKNGRSTEKQGWLLKLKRFEDSEATILSSFEQMHNDNVAFENELGRTARSSAQAGLVGTGVLGGFNVRDMKTKVVFSIGTGFDAAQRKQYWIDQKQLVGKNVKYKFFPSGSKDKPRHPVFLGFRDERDTGE